MAAVIFVLDKKTDLISAPHASSTSASSSSSSTSRCHPCSSASRTPSSLSRTSSGRTYPGLYQVGECDSNFQDARPILLGKGLDYSVFEHLSCSFFSAIFLGGVMDSLQEMFYGKPKTEESEEKKNGKDSIEY